MWQKLTLNTNKSMFFFVWFRFVLLDVIFLFQHGCGTRAPLWLSSPTGGLPPPGKKARSHACASFEVPGRELKCCGLKFPITVKNCGEFFVYRLRSTKGCDLAYCAEGMFICIYIYIIYYYSAT